MQLLLQFLMRWRSFCIFTASKKLTLSRIWFRQECWRSGRERTSAPERWPPPGRGRSEWRRRPRWWIVRRRTVRDESPCQGGTEACLRLVRDIASSTVGVVLLVRVVSKDAFWARLKHHSMVSMETWPFSILSSNLCKCLAPLLTYFGIKNQKWW